MRRLLLTRVFLVWLLSISLIGQQAFANSDVPALPAATTLSGATAYLANAGANDNSVGLSTSVFTISAGNITLNAGGVTNTMLANSATTVNSQTCTLGSTCTVAAAAGTLTGSTLASGVTASSLTSLGTLTGLTMGGTLALGTNSLTGNFTVTGVPTFSGSLTGTQTQCLGLTSGNVLAASSGACGSGSGTPAFSSLTSGTNTGAAMVVGSGATLGVSGSGTIAATSAPASGITGATLASGVTASSLTSVGTLTGLTMGGTVAMGTNTISGNFTVSGAPIFSGTLTGTQTQCLGLTSGNVLAASSGACGTGGSSAFSSLTSGTNTAAAMLVGTGASLGATGSGTITATAAPASGITGTTLATNVVTSSLTTVGTIGTGTWNSGFGSSATECSSSSFGLCKVDGTTITASGGVITAVGGSATSIVPGTTTIAGGGSPCVIANTTGTVMGCVAYGQSGASTIIETGAGGALAAGILNIGIGSGEITSGTTGYLLYNNAGVPGNETIASILTAGNGVTISGTTNATINSGYYSTIANAASTGTTNNKLAKLTGAPSTFVITATTDPPAAVAVGVVVSGGGTSGDPVVAFNGPVQCIFDGATTAGHAVGISTATAGDCTDLGSSPSQNQIIGTVTSTNASGGTYTVMLNIGADSSLASPTAANQIIESSAAGAAAWQTTGTGVLTALGVNVGSAGAIVVNGGALGTPSSGTATNLTGLPLSGLASESANTVVGNATSGSASPTALTMTSCSAAADAVSWTTNTGFGCNTSITAAAVPASGITGTTLASNVVTSSLTTVGTIATGTWNSGFGSSATEASSSVFGLVKVDGTTITASGGVITAVGGAATSITPGTTTIVGATAPCAIVNSASTTMACDALGTGVVTALGDAVNTNGGILTASTAAIASNAIVTGAGSGTALTGTTPGSGVLTALGDAANATGGFGTVGTSGSNVCLLNANCTISGQETFTATPAVTPTTISSGTCTGTYSLTPTGSASVDYVITCAASAAITLANPTTPLAGSSLNFRIKQPGSGSAATLSAVGTDYLFPGGTLPTLSTGSNDIDLISCRVISSSEIDCAPPMLALANP